MVLSQTAIVANDRFSNVPANPGDPSPAERRMRWSTWEVLVHEYIHTLAHPSFNDAAGGNRILTEGLCELFTRAVLDTGGAITAAKADAGRVHNIGLKPDGTMIDPSAPDASQLLAPGKVVVPSFVTSVTGVSVMTGAPEEDIVAANSGLVPGGPLPADARTTGLDVPGTSYHRAIAVHSETERVVETKDKIAQQHGTTVDAVVRANPNLNHREPREGEWVLIPAH